MPAYSEGKTRSARRATSVTYSGTVIPDSTIEVAVGDLWVDLSATVLKQCTSISPVTFVSVTGQAVPGPHVLATSTGLGSEHTTSGLTTGHFLKATGATTAAFGAHGLVASDVGAEASANKNIASGYPGLDGSSKLTGSQQVYGTVANTACEGNDSRLSRASFDGADGDEGEIGPPGVPGAQGIPGQTIIVLPQDGEDGELGLPGMPGTTGLPGSQGLPGMDGLDGEEGFANFLGVAGPAGQVGPIGAPGQDGDAGDDGLIGPQGIAGVAGLVGFVGAPGQDGDTGDDGIPGPQGIQGSPGSPGLPGNDIEERVFSYISKLFEINNLLTFTPEELEV